MHIGIINGPNLNLLGRREPEVYGAQSWADIEAHLRLAFPQLQISCFQSNIEGELVGAIQDLGFRCDALIINAGAYTHTSIALADALQAVPAPAIEVHLSNTAAREAYRHTSFLTPVCRGLIMGFGPKSYHLALQACMYEL